MNNPMTFKLEEYLKTRKSKEKNPKVIHRAKKHIQVL